MKKKTTGNKAVKLNWTYQPPKINGGKDNLDQKSMIIGLYDDYLVTKTGNLAGILEISGVNLDLLNRIEQEDVFSDYGAFLMSTLGEGVNDSLQFIELTIPVNMTGYLNGLKRRYLHLKAEQPAAKFKIQLLASYIDYFTQVQNTKSMTTKQHLLAVKVPIKDKSVLSLQLAVKNLTEKMDQVKRDLENALTDFDLTVKVLDGQAVLTIIKDQLNFKG